ncbi:MAG TPA: HAD-IA family hydrolase [Alphaproteobacteria bacterium]|nr:HAD-IA family hydrolase [Alphaproteobacteria bacterium]
MPALKGLIFDLDGTLLDSAPDLRQAINATLKAHRRRSVTLEEVMGMVGDGMLPMLSRAFALTGTAIPDSESYLRFQEFISHYRTMKPDPSQLYPHTAAILEQYSKAGVKLGICTNKQEAATKRLIDDLGLTRYFTFIAGGDTFPTHKPHPDHVRGVIQMLQVPKESCVMIGDSTNDVLAAKGTGIPCLVVTHGYGFDVEELGADGLLKNFEELPAALTKLRFDLG